FLPWAIAGYVSATGDDAILDEEVPFLEGDPVPPGESDAFILPVVSKHVATLYEHGVRAIERGFTEGAHGLPLIGSCDWNDGLNRVGPKGRGESVWLGWFLFATLGQWAPIAAARGERARAERWSAHAVA